MDNQISFPKSTEENQVSTLPSVERVIMELLLHPTKSAVDILRNCYYDTINAPKYECKRISQHDQTPVFRATVTAGEAFAFGMGENKKKAKNAAAKNLLRQITSQPLTNDGGNLTLCFPTKNRSAKSNELDNPVGKLQEMCKNRGWAVPEYELIAEECPVHSQLFTTICSAQNISEVGVGTSKYNSKNAAAMKMCKRLHEHDSQPQLCSGEVSSKPNACNEYTKNLTVAKNTNFQTIPILQFQTFDENMNSEEIVNLEKLASDKNFDVTYVNLKEKTQDGERQCLVRLSPPPVIICYGSGLTFKAAQAAAARHAAVYLNIKDNH